MATYLRNQVVDALKSVFSPLNLLNSFSNDQGPDHSGRSNTASINRVSSKSASTSASMHIEPSMERIAIRSAQDQSTHTFPNSNSQPEAMTNRDGRRAPVLHAGESAQRRLF